MLRAAAATISVRRSLFMSGPQLNYVTSTPNCNKKTHGGRRRPPCSMFVPRPAHLPLSILRLRNSRTGDRRNAANRRRTSRKLRSRDEHLIPLGRRRTTLHASTCEGIDVGKRCREAVREGLEEGNDLVLLRIGQA